MRNRSKTHRRRRPAASVIEESLGTLDSVNTERTDPAWTRQFMTTQMNKLKVQYQAVAKAITDKRGYRMTNWQE